MIKILRILPFWFCCLFFAPNLSADIGVQSGVQPIQVKVFIAAMFEIGRNTGDKPGEFQYWYDRYFVNSQVIDVPGALSPVYCNNDGVCGTVLGMGKVASSASMQAILLNAEFNFSNAFFFITGVAGIPPSKGTIGDVSWATWLVDYDLGHRWSPLEEPNKEHAFMPRSGYENMRCFKLNRKLVERAFNATKHIKLVSSKEADKYRQRYPQKSARRQPMLLLGTHMTGDTFFHGPGLSGEAQYITELYGADDYIMTEMEAAAVTQVINRQFGTDRILSLRVAVNFDQASPGETTLQHLDPAPGNTAGGFDQSLRNIVAVGGQVVDDMTSNWSAWQSNTATNL